MDLSNWSESEAEWCGTWRPQNSNTKDQIGIMMTEGKLLALLLTHYDLIVYLGFSLWRKLVHRSIYRKGKPTWKLLKEDDGGVPTGPGGSGNLPGIISLLPGVDTKSGSARPDVLLTATSGGDELFVKTLVAAIGNPQIDLVVVLVTVLRLDLSVPLRCAKYPCSILCQAAIFDAGKLLGVLLDLLSVVQSVLSPADHVLLLNYATCFSSCDATSMVLTHPSLRDRTPEVINSCDSFGETPLTSGTREGCSSRIISLLLAHGADLESADEYGTPLMRAASRKYNEDGNENWSTHEGLVRFLIEDCGNPDTQDADGDTALHAAAGPARNCSYAARSWGSRGWRASILATLHKTTPLHKASWRPDWRVVDLLKERGADVDAFDSNGNKADLRVEDSDSE